MVLGESRETVSRAFERKSNREDERAKAIKGRQERTRRRRRRRRHRRRRRRRRRCRRRRSGVDRQ